MPELGVAGLAGPCLVAPVALVAPGVLVVLVVLVAPAGSFLVHFVGTFPDLALALALADISSLALVPDLGVSSLLDQASQVSSQAQV
ncbi:unnamed protein product [Rhizoctonia solani]|uniref:Uncharacterized protein n=1 Tax=Rhizoctonia solani TaxID=456999 RepID=A0A8H2XCJ1_9AGAM|nr:unnamed protein product [Rhizoctonia solani]